MIGEIFGNYRIVAKIGAGGMGVVWLGEHQLLGSRAAIKVLLPELAQPKLIARFFDEAKAASRIQDPGIVTVLDFGWRDDKAYIVMEYVKGESLTTRLGMGKLPALQAVRVLQYAALAMAAAHARGIVHRDLKPDNIFVIGDPAVPGGERIKILDFGIAKLIDDAPREQPRTVTGTIMGTPAYMSPEQCRGAGEVDHRTDIYALGCVLFQLLTGRPPFIAGAPGDLIASHLREAAPAPSAFVADLSPAIDALVAKCLAKSPDDRFQSMTEVVRAGAAITGEAKSVPTLPPLRPSSEGVTIETLPPDTQKTTLGQSAGQSVGQSVVTGASTGRKTWPLVLGAVLILGVIGLAVALGISNDSVRSTAPRPPIAIDAARAAATPDAAIADATALAIDARSIDARSIDAPSHALEPRGPRDARTIEAPPIARDAAVHVAPVVDADPYTTR